MKGLFAAAWLLSVLFCRVSSAETSVDFLASPDTVATIVTQTRHVRLLLVGEMHGTQESPALIDRIVEQWTHLSAAGETHAPVIVGLEYPQAEADALAVYLDSDGGPEATTRYLDSPFWSRKYQDGRSSKGMFALIEAMRQRIKGGSDIRIRPFDMSELQIIAKEERDHAMADNLRAVVAANPTARVVALMGNYHARQKDGAPWNPTYRFMGGHLKNLSPFSLLVEARRGEYWGCSGQTAADCKEVSFEREDGPVGLHFDASIKAQGYDLALMLDRFSISLPKNIASLNRTATTSTDLIHPPGGPSF